MGRQIWWVLRTYLSNKVFLAALAGVSLFLIAGMGKSRSLNESNLPSVPRGRVVVLSTESLAAVRRLGAQDQVDEIDLQALWWSMEREQQAAAKGTPRANQFLAPTTSFFDVVEEFPNLRIVLMDFIDSREAIRKLADRRGITCLKVNGLRDVTALAGMQDLERLELRVYEPIEGLAALASLPKLKTLMIAGHRAVDDRVLEAVASLPHLESFGIADPNGNSAITNEGLRYLEKSPRLKVFYVGGGIVPPQADILARAENLLPKLDVRPAVISSRIPSIAGLAPAAFAIAVGYVVLKQFRAPASRLSPQFLGAHCVVVVGWLTLTTVVVFATMVRGGQPAPISLVLAASSTIWMFAGGLEAVNKRATTESARMSIWDRIFAMSFLLVWPVIFFSNPDFVERWQSVLVALAAIVGLSSTWRAVSSLRRISALAESLPGDAAQAAPAFGQYSLRQAVFRRENLVESWGAHPPEWTTWRRIQRWRLGNQPIPVLLFMILFTFGAALGMYAFSATRNEAALRANLCFVPVMLLFSTCGQAASAWRKRLSCLEVESLRPISRSSLQREWTISLLLDLLPGAAIVGVLTALMLHVNLTAISLRDWQAVISDWPGVLATSIFFSIAIWIITTGLCSLLIVVERTWLRLTLALGLLIACAIVVGPQAAWTTELPRRDLLPEEYIPLLWLPSIMCAIVATGMWNVWTRIDFDRRP